MNDIILILSLSVLSVLVVQRFHLPAIIGYLLVGTIIGPHAFGLIEFSETTRSLGEIGVVFLLFTIGLDFSIAQLRSFKTTLFGLGSAQVLVGTVFGGWIAWYLGIEWKAAIIVGGALALSSTAIVIKQLTDQLELKTRYGRASLGILLFQDLAAVPFLVLIPIFAAGNESVGTPLLLAFIKGLIAFFAILFVGRFVLRPVFHVVAGTRSEELFTITVLLISLAAAWVTHLLGLSLALGAFLAGMMLSETEYRHQIEAEIRPFRDILLALFFITVGMQLNLLMLPEIWHWVLLLVAGLIIGKGLVIYFLLLLFGQSRDVASRTGAILANGGEFGIALLTLAVITNLINYQDTQPILAALILSMVIAPLLIRKNHIFSNLIMKKDIEAGEDLPGQIAEGVGMLEDHIVICGYGSVGKQIATILEQNDYAYICLDNNIEVVKKAWLEDEPVFYGDARKPRILSAAKLAHARALVICIDSEENALQILKQARKISTCSVYVRIRSEQSADIFMAEGATEIVAETLETGSMMAAQLLIGMDREPKEVFDQVARSRKQYLGG